ncbi:MAG: LptF/LptG family permease [Rickettsiales bacterium]|jgi:lipopolysaccharide export system permease protein|nr:LptF/LptG family permease [Rickettsiales bacterium]
MAFPFGTIISRFLSAKFIKSLGLVLFIVCAVILSISFVEELGGSDTAWRAFANALAKLLEWMPLFLPLTIFMAVLLMTYQLIRSSEMIIIQSAGLSPLRIMRPVALSAMMVGVLATTILNPLSINFSRHLAGAGSHATHTIDGKIWLSENLADSRVLLRAARVEINRDSAAFPDSTLWIQVNGSRDLVRIESPEILLEDGEFSGGKNAVIYGMDGVPTAAREWRIKSNITLQNLRERYMKPAEISFWDLPEFIRSLDRMGMNNRPHIVQLWSLLFMPLSLAAMVALGMAFSQTRERRFHSFGLKISMGVLVSFILYFTINLFGSLGSAGMLPAWVAVAMPPLAIAFFSLTYIVSFNKN